MSATLLHAGCVSIEGRGVLVLGASGSGKSDLMLRLIDRGATLVADDYCELRAVDGRLFARAPANIAGRMEVRGIGLIALPALDEAAVALAIRVDAPVPRLPEAESEEVAGIAVPLVRLAPFEASAPIKAELALRGVPAGVDWRHG